jgi:hypothetical protein
MNPRHTIAFALLGWYLMVPPPVIDQSIADTNAPLAWWELFRSFDTAPDCESVRQAYQAGVHTPSVASELKKRAAQQGKVWNQRLAIARAKAALCVASDDPRLKGNHQPIPPSNSEQRAPI